MVSDVLVGYFARLYLSTASEDPPTWEEVERARDVLVRNDAATIDFPVRNRGKYSMPLRGVKYCSLEFSVLHDPTKEDAQNETLRAAYFDGTILDLWAADGQLGAADGYNAEGLRGDFYLRSMSQPQRINRVVFVTYVAEPAGLYPTTPENKTRSPQWYSE